MEMSRHTSDPSWQDLATFGNKFFKQVRILIIDGFSGDIDATARHDPVGPSKIGSAFSGLRFHELLHLPMKGMSAKEGIIFLLLKPAGGIEALLIAGRHVTRGRFAFRLGLRAFYSDNVPRHDG